MVNYHNIENKRWLNRTYYKAYGADGSKWQVRKTAGYDNINWKAIEVADSAFPRVINGRTLGDISAKLAALVKGN